MIYYGVWFHGSTEEPAAFCMENRKPFVAKTKEAAEEYMMELSTSFLEEKYSVCTITVESGQ